VLVDKRRKDIRGLWMDVQEERMEGRKGDTEDIVIWK
jgi:hypothetical protein